MSVYRPTYTDKKTGKQKHTKVWYYEFIFAGRLIKEPAKTTSKTVAKEAEKKRRRELEEGFNGIGDARDERVRPIRELAETFYADYSVRQPKSATFAEYAIRHIVRILGEMLAVDVTDRTVLNYQTSRLNEGASPKTINEEVGFLLRFLGIVPAGALRAQLRQQKRLKLKVNKRVGKAYTQDEKVAIVTRTQISKSKSIHLQTMLALHAGLRDREIRTLQWDRFDLVKRMITVGQTKSDAGTGRTIPMNQELLFSATEYAKWYTGKFGDSKPDWYVFPFGKPAPQDPTRPQTSLKTAWRNVRADAKVEGRFHDNRHTFVTDLSESGAGDQVIQDMAGHVSRDMVKHYSHIRTEAKRRAVAALTSRPAEQKPENSQFSDVVLQEVLQVSQVN
jgi:integrase